MCYRLFISKKKWTDNYKNKKKSKQTRGRASPSQSFIWELPWGIFYALPKYVCPITPTKARSRWRETEMF